MKKQHECDCASWKILVEHKANEIKELNNQLLILSKLLCLVYAIIEEDKGK